MVPVLIYSHFVSVFWYPLYRPSVYCVTEDNLELVIFLLDFLVCMSPRVPGTYQNTRHRQCWRLNPVPSHLATTPTVFCPSLASGLTSFPTQVLYIVPTPWMWHFSRKHWYLQTILNVLEMCATLLLPRINSDVQISGWSSVLLRFSLRWVEARKRCLSSVPRQLSDHALTSSSLCWIAIKTFKKAQTEK